jgi:hypothetical protein
MRGETIFAFSAVASVAKVGGRWSTTGPDRTTLGLFHVAGDLSVSRFASGAAAGAGACIGGPPIIPPSRKWHRTKGVDVADSSSTKRSANSPANRGGVALSSRK